MIFSASQAFIIFHDTFQLEYPRSATLLPRAPPITGGTLSTMRVPSTAIFRATISGPPTNTCTVLCQVGQVDPVVQSRKVIVELRQVVRSVKYARRISPIVQRAARPTTLA